MTTLIDLDDLERKARAATPGPWTADATDIVHDLAHPAAQYTRSMRKIKLRAEKHFDRCRLA